METFFVTKVSRGFFLKILFVFFIRQNILMNGSMFFPHQGPFWNTYL